MGDEFFDTTEVTSVYENMILWNFQIYYGTDIYTIIG